MARPALVVVYDDQQRLAELKQALQRRFGSDNQILAAATPTPDDAADRPTDLMADASTAALRRMRTDMRHPASPASSTIFVVS
jgi:hypothetical protein